jgi:acetyl-CoA synthetase
MEEYRRLYDRSVKDPEGFWAEQAEALTWSRKWDRVLEWQPPFAKWFVGGTLNLSENCLDRHVAAGRGGKTAILWEGEPGRPRAVSYAELLAEVKRFANVLRGLGVAKGDRVGIYMPMIPEAAVAMLGCARIGAVHSVVFGGFSSEALRDRMNDAQARLIVTADGGYRRGAVVPLKASVDGALAGAGCPSVKTVVVVRRTAQDVPMEKGRDHWWHERMAQAGPECPPEPHEAEHPLFILYTSGTTGKPKGVVHTTAGYLLQAALTSPPGLRPQGRGPLLVHGRHRLGHGPLLRRLRPAGQRRHQRHVRRGAEPSRAGPVLVHHRAPPRHRPVHRAHRHPGLRALGRAVAAQARPRQPAAAGDGGGAHQPRGLDVVPPRHRRRPLPDRGHVVADGDGRDHDHAPARRHAHQARLGTLPFFGVVPEVVDKDGRAAEAGAGGYLVIRKPWPGMLRTIYGDPDRYVAQYWSRFPGSYFTGDGARCDEDGYFWIMGRVDDVINVAGHRLGTMEVESALVSHERVAEAAVVGRPDDLKGQALVAFVTVQSGVKADEALRAALKEHVAKEIGAIARPDDIRFTDALPKTRSGKIMRRLLRDIASKKELGDTTTLEDFSVLARLREEEE